MGEPKQLSFNLDANLKENEKINLRHQSLRSHSALLEYDSSTDKDLFSFELFSRDDLKKSA